MGWSKIAFNAIFDGGSEGYQLLVIGSKILIVANVISVSSSGNTYNYIAAAQFNRNYITILNFEAKNISPPIVAELET